MGLVFPWFCLVGNKEERRWLGWWWVLLFLELGSWFFSGNKKGKEDNLHFFLRVVNLMKEGLAVFEVLLFISCNDLLIFQSLVKVKSLYGFLNSCMYIWKRLDFYGFGFWWQQNFCFLQIHLVDSEMGPSDFFYLIVGWVVFLCLNEVRARAWWFWGELTYKFLIFVDTKV